MNFGIIGAGLAGTSLAYALAQQGARVTLYERQSQPAHGASSIPVGIFSPRISYDDNANSQLIRWGIRHSVAQFETLLRQHIDWGLTGIDEINAPPRRLAQYAQLTAAHPELKDWSTVSNGNLHHHLAGWVYPTRLVEAWLAHPNIRFVGDHPVSTPAAIAALLAEHDAVVLANSLDAAVLWPSIRPILLPIRGQITLGATKLLSKSLTLKRTVNGRGHYTPAFHYQGQLHWATGATFERDVSHTHTSRADQDANGNRLSSLCPSDALLLQPLFTQHSPGLKNWAGVRAYSPDRLPLVGQLSERIYINIAYASRGLSLAPICAAYLAAQMMQPERSVLPPKLAQHIDVRRFFPLHS